ncbi:hypothetical protein [Streptomyces sp. G1]|uniref:hypothetical protein n=1 Tax=Streptomyces sp. G1 TaxID=361572 RepID=UPI0020305297|nr:hypothetical protein [Streptomyces sp. G1]MCM1973344.1 hypothetical protein [Streptomyces sp. G1]
MTERSKEQEQGGQVRELLATRADEVSLPDGWADRVLRDGKRAVGRRRLAATTAAVAAVAAVGVLLSGLPGTGEQPPASRPEWATADSVPQALRKMPVGPDTDVPYGTRGEQGKGALRVMLGGRAIPIPKEYTGLRIWRAGDRGFVYLADGPGDVAVVVHVDADGTSTELERTAKGEYTTQLNVSEDGRFAAWTVHPNEGRSQVVKRADLTTGKVGSRSYDDIDSVHGFAGDDVLINWDARVQNIGSLDRDGTPWPSADRDGGVEDYSVASDTVLLSTSDGCMRAYSIAQPDNQRWKVCDMEDVHFSPDGQRFVALREGGYVVSDTSSGEVTGGLWSVPSVHPQDMAWEDDDTVLLELAEAKPARTKDGMIAPIAPQYGPSYLVRCHVEQERCELVDTGGPVKAFPSSGS